MKQKTIDSLYMLYRVSLSTAFYSLIILFVWWVVPEIRYRADKTEYYKVISAKVVTEEPKVCESIELLLTRVALQDIQGHAISELVLVRINQPDKEVARKIDELSINKGTEVVAIDYDIPCNAIKGEYFWRGSVKYEVHGYEHISLWKSDVFTVK